MFLTFHVQSKVESKWVVVEQCRCYEGATREEALDELGWAIMEEETQPWKTATLKNPTAATSGRSCPAPDAEPWTWPTASVPK